MKRTRSAKVCWNGEFAGLLKRFSRDHYVFEYDEKWFSDPQKPPVSLTLPKSRRRWEANHLFPFFANLLSEGANKREQCRYFKIDEEDHFSHLLATAGFDTAGAVTIKPVEESEPDYAAS